MEGWTWKALCNEAPFRFGKNLTSSEIRNRDPVIWSRKLTVRPRGRFTPKWDFNKLVNSIKTLSPVMAELKLVCGYRSEPRHKKTCYAISEHPRSLISAFVVGCLHSIIPLVSISEMSSLCLASVAARRVWVYPGRKPRRPVSSWRGSSEP